MAEVRTESLTKIFSSQSEIVVAVNEVSVTIPDEEFAVFVGPSGSGKTTFLRLVAGLEAASSGHIYIGRKGVTNLHPRERGIAMVFQDYALYPHMSVFQNLSFALRNLRFPRSEIEARVQRTAEMLQIEMLLDRKPRELSGGQRQRVALGRAIVRQPQVFLFDEPLSNLDAKLRSQMRVELAELQDKLKTTAIYVTHDQVEAMTLGHRIFVMNHGVVQQAGTGDELYNTPENVFVATFIGSPEINLLHATLVTENGDLRLAVCGQSIPVPPGRETVLRHSVGRDVLLGVRPEQIHLGTTSPAGPSLRAHVRLVEHLGSKALVHFELAGDAIVAEMESDVPVSAGDNCSLIIDVERVHLFDPDTEERIR